MRKEKHLSRMEPAIATDLSQSAIAKWATGKAEPTTTNIWTLAAYFGISTDYLLGRVDWK